MADPRVLIDINSAAFQKQWFSLPKPEQLAANATIAKVRQLTWDQLYRDKGLRWELIQSRSLSNGTRIYSLRITKKNRAVVRREGDILTFVSIHVDHDSAYQ